MSDRPDHDDTPRNDAPQDDASPGAAGQAFPRRRRRASLTPDSPSDPAAPVAAPAEADAVPAAEPALDAAPPADAPANPPPAPARTSRPAPAADTPKDVPLARRLVRIVLILAVAGAGAYVLLVLAPASNAGQRRLAARIDGPAIPKVEPDPEADRLGVELLKRVDAGNLDDILDRADALRQEHPDHPLIQTAVFKAESAQAVLDAAKRLDALPAPEPQNPAVPVPTNIERLQIRMQHLDVLQGQYRDWRDDLVRIPGVRETYDRFRDEIQSAPQQLSDWRAGHRFLREALAALTAPEPEFERAAQLLRTAWGYLPLRDLLQAAENANHVAQARRMLDHHVVARAVEHLKQTSFAPGTDATAEPATTLAAIDRRLHALWTNAQNKVGAWDELNTALQQAQAAYADGRVEAAVARIDQALPKADPDNALTQNIARRLRELKAHYAKVESTWNAALATKAEQGLREQLAAWAAFQRVLQEGDTHYQAALRDELRAIKSEIIRRIATGHAALTRAGEGYTPITLEMRKPQNPRAPFAAQARRLQAMAVEAEKVRDAAQLVPNWDLGHEATAQVDEAESILQEHNDQARRLYNLYKLYHRLGKVDLARECLERVRLLGDVSSNPWYAEVTKALEG